MAGNKRPKRITRSKRTQNDSSLASSFRPTVYHALVVIFLEFFAWGLLTTPTINITQSTFPQHTFLCNGLIQGVKGLLSFLSAPLVGALSDIMGRKPFLLLTVSCTCAPIPFMMISPWWYFALISLSGVFAVTFSVVFAYVADITTDEERSSAYGLVSATFAASLITSPAIGVFIETAYSQNVVILLATAIAVLDVIFILIFMPESLPEKMRPVASWGSHITWDKADPFAALKKLGHDHLILLLCVTVFLSYLPEAGEYSCFFVYLKLVMNFSKQQVTSFIAFVGILSVLAQTVMLGLLMTAIGAKNAIIIGLTAEMIQLAMYGFGSATWLMWLAGVIAAISSITYPAISAFVSSHCNPDQQGKHLIYLNGIKLLYSSIALYTVSVIYYIYNGKRCSARSGYWYSRLCMGLGPALFGFIFYLFNVDLNDSTSPSGVSAIQPLPNHAHILRPNDSHSSQDIPFIPGPPFAVGAILVFCAVIVATYIPRSGPQSQKLNNRQSLPRQNSLTSTPLIPVMSGSKPYDTENFIHSSDEQV